MWQKIMFIDFNRLKWLINGQLLSAIEYHRFIDYIFNDRFLSIRYAQFFYNNSKISQTKWSVPLKIALMHWLFETWTR